MKKTSAVLAVVVLCGLAFWMRAQSFYFFTDTPSSPNMNYWTSSCVYDPSSSQQPSCIGSGLMYNSSQLGGEVASTLNIQTTTSYNNGYQYASARFAAVLGSSASGSPCMPDVSQMCNFYLIQVDTWNNASLYWISGPNSYLLASQTVSVHNGSVLRAVEATSGGSTFNAYVALYVDGVIAFSQEVCGGCTASSFPAGYFGVSWRTTSGDGNSISSVSLAHADTTAPSAVTPSVSAYYNHIDFQWSAASDSGGSGVYEYQLSRGGSPLTTIYANGSLSYSDTTVVPNTQYSYTLSVTDYHFNTTTTSFNVTTPHVQFTGPLPSATPEGRRVGVRATGAYWGASPENIDVLSGNLNFALPLMSGQGRSGWSAGFNLVYNSQNWRHDSGGNWIFGGDVGYGFGWRLMAGSITPVWNTGGFTANYYLFTDSTGAEYRLDQNNDNIWSSQQSINVWFDANTNILHFRDGSFWTFGCISALGEADQGVMYPTLMEDTNGNQVLISYLAAPGASWTNSSARISTIEDVRAVYQGSNTYTTYSFTYNNDTPRHLTSISNTIGTGENYSFVYYDNQTLYSPFDSTTHGTVKMLHTATVSNIGTYHQFTYNSSGEMTQALLPYKGYLAYDYTTTTYSSGRSYREVQHRYLSKDGSTQTTYPFTHEPSPGPDVHQYTILDDPGGLGEKYWAFNTSGTYEALVSQYQGRQGQGGSAVAKMQNDFTWSQDGVGNSFISSSLATADPGQSYQAQSKTAQSVDNNGNVTQVQNYAFGNLSTAARTSTYTYLSSSAYTSRYILNRLTQASLTDGTNSVTLASVTYDLHTPTTISGQREWDTAYSSSVTARGNVGTVTTPGSYKEMWYDVTGNTTSASVNGVTTSVTSSSTTNFAVPSQMTVGSLSTSMSYSSFLGLTNETGPNSNSVSLGYDANARPTSSTSPFGGGTSTSYADTASPPTTTTTAPDGHWSKTTLDGLGRPLKVETGYSSTTVSAAESVYGSCGCSPLGKLMQQAVPHAPGANPAYTTYSYDGLGRTLSVVAADGASTTSYAYQGNTVVVTDPAGKWKKFTMDAFGNLVQVNEPNPAGGSDYVTTYTYDFLNHLTGVSMTRGSTTQTRSFVYSTNNQLVSATNPENGTVAYTYNSYGKVATRVDAAGHKVAYTYDSYARLAEVQRYPTQNGAEDTCQQENYGYDANAFDSSYSQNVLGRLATVQYWGGHDPNVSGGCHTEIIEMYTYGAPGAPTGKRVRVIRNYRTNPSAPGYANMNADLNSTFAYDNQGRLTSEGYPTDNAGATASLGWTYDSMGRLYSMKDQLANQNIIDSASYGPAGELLSMTGSNWGTETRSYNVLKQLTQLTSNGVSIQYNYSSTQNNGKITSQTDLVSGEQVSYSYDSLNRLISASATGSGGSAFDHWSDGGALSHTVTVPSSATTYTATYSSTSSQVATPSFNVAGGTYSSSQTVAISTTTAGSDIYYTTDGSTPTTSSTHYTSAITVASSLTLKAIGHKSGLSDSTAGVAAYTISSGGSWSNGYTYRRTITIDHTKVPTADQSSFPVLVSGTYSYLATTGNGGNVTNANGYDIIFTSDSAGSSTLAFEREVYTPSSGAINYWVKVPTVSHSADTVIYLFYGNSSVSSDPSNKTAVWDSNYAGVLHLGNGTTLSGADSTGNANNGALGSGVTATTGEIDGGASFNGNGAIDLNNAVFSGFSSAITMEFWTKYTATGQYFIVSGNSHLTVAAYSFAIGVGIPTTGTEPFLYFAGSANDGAWHHVVVTYDSATGYEYGYVDGASSGSATGSGTITALTSEMSVGAWAANNAPYFNGSMDEVRFSNIARSSTWIATEYNNESSPSAFYSVGSAQTNGGGGGNVSITVTSSVSGMTMTVDGTNCTAPCSFTWASGSSHTIAGPSSTGSSAWSQGYNYDGFGNLTAITGTQANSWSYDAATNHGAYSDANGNGQSAASGGAYTYDIENRIINTGSANGNYTYGYAPGNKRVWRATWSDNSNFQLQMPATDEITFWSPTGQKMGTYQLGITWVTSSVDNSACVTSFYATQTGTNYYFGGKLIKNAPGAVYSDRLGSVGQYYPYGTDRGSGNPSSGEKFATYSQDSETGLDYAINRYQQPGSGRFLTPDRLGGSASDPGSWNRYAYTGGDPVNGRDPEGDYSCPPGVDFCMGPLPWEPPDGSLPDPSSISATCAMLAGTAWAGTPQYQQYCGGLPVTPIPPTPTDPGGSQEVADKPCPDYIKKFFTSETPILTDMANKLNINVDFLFALSARETGYGQSTAAKNGNLFGASDANENPLSYSSPQASADAWVARWGKDIEGVQDAKTFFQNLVNDGYNSHEGYVDSMVGQVADTKRWNGNANCH